MAYIHGGSILRHYASSLHGLPHSIVTEVPLIRCHDGKPSPVFLPGKSQGQRRLAGYSPWGHKESDTTEHTTHQISLIQTTGGCVSIRERTMLSDQIR